MCLKFTWLKVFVMIFHFVPSSKCTVDIDRSLLEYIANQLTTKECRLLVASLHFTSYELPAALKAAEKKVPEESCIKLLLEWNSRTYKLQGSGKTHEEVVRRLRQLGKNVLAEWLGVAVYDQLARDIVETLLNDTYLELPRKMSSQDTRFRVKGLDEEDIQWVVFDLVLWLTFLALVGALMFLLSRIVCFAFSSSAARKRLEVEEMSLLKSEFIVLEDNEKTHSNG